MRLLLLRRAKGRLAVHDEVPSYFSIIEISMIRSQVVFNHGNSRDKVPICFLIIVISVTRSQVIIEDWTGVVVARFLPLLACLAASTEVSRVPLWLFGLLHRQRSESRPQKPLPWGAGRR